MKKIFLLSLILYGPVFCTAQSPQIEWAKVFGSSQYASAADIKPTPDGNLIVLAFTGAADSDVICTPKGNSDAWVFKIDMDGNILWQQCYGGSGAESAFTNGRILTTPDGGYIFMSKTSSYDGDVIGNTSEDQVWIVKLDSSGNIIWQRAYGGDGSEFPLSIVATSDDGYIFTATSNTTNGSGDIPFHYGSFLTDDAWVVKIDSGGDIIWNRVFGGTGDDFLSSIAIRNDSIFLFGHTSSNDNDLLGHQVHNGASWIVGLNAQASILLNKTYSTAIIQSFTAGMVTSTGNLIGCGDSDSSYSNVGTYHGAGDVLLIKTDIYGNKIWQGLYGGSSGDACWYDDLQEAPYNSGYYLGCISLSNDGDITNHHGSTARYDFWIVKVDTAGALLWQTSIGGSQNDRLQGLGIFSIALFPVGYTESSDGDFSPFPEGSFAAAIVKLNDFTSINETQSQNHSIKIYPNPSNGVVTMLFDQRELNESTLVRITTIEGKTLTVIRAPHNPVIWDANDQHSGTYFCTLSQNNRTIAFYKITLVK